jgi:hypothetical protein
MKDENNCDPAYGTDWADTDIMSVMGAAKAGIPGAVAQLEKWEKELLLSIDPISTDKSADIEKGNPNRDPRTGQFTFGAGGPQSGGGGGGGAEDGDGAEGGAGGAEGAGAEGEMAKGTDKTSELAQEYGKDSETKRGAELRAKDTDPGTRGDPTLEDIARKQGFDGEAELVDQATFDEVVAKGGTVTYRGITPHYDGPGPDAAYIDGDAAITEQFAEGEYFAGLGVYGNGTYTSTDLLTAKHYATEDDAGGSIVTMAIKPGAKIASPEEWAEARTAAKAGKGGFMGADDEGRILAARGFDGYRVKHAEVDHPANEFIVVTNRTALVVLKP